MTASIIRKISITQLGRAYHLRHAVKSYKYVDGLVPSRSVGYMVGVTFGLWPHQGWAQHCHVIYPNLIQEAYMGIYAGIGAVLSVQASWASSCQLYWFCRRGRCKENGTRHEGCCPSQRRLIIPQGAFLFSGSVCENIDPSDTESDAQLNDMFELIHDSSDSVCERTD
nr:hypothetical protein L203_00809 [Cryptococcus depauperatus CBS 7841]